MPVAAPGSTLSTQLDIYVRDVNGFPTEPFSIGYGIFLKSGVDLTLVTGTDTLLPQSDAVGHYYVYWQVPSNATIGEYRVIWRIQQSADSPVDIAQQDFSIVSLGEVPQQYDVSTRTLIKAVRTLLRDNNPDRNYHFRPPASERERDGMTLHFGYIWEDDEIVVFTEMAVAAYNFAPPQSGFTLGGITPDMRYPIAMMAALMAITAVSLNWVADEFDYSIGGKSLTIDKSSKYQSIASDFRTDIERILEQKKSIRHVAGVMQRSRGLPLMGSGSSGRLSTAAYKHAIGFLSSGWGF